MLSSIAENLSRANISFTINEVAQEVYTNHKLSNHEVSIRAKVPDDFPVTLPNFHLVDRTKYGLMAHVAWGNNGYGDICIGHKESFSVDLHNPGKVFIEALNESLKIVDKALNDSHYNKTELMKEFAAVWRFHCSSNSRLIAILENSNETRELTIRSRSTNSKNNALDQALYAYEKGKAFHNQNHFLVRDSTESRRINRGKGIAISIENLCLPPAPDEPINTWWENQVSQLTSKQQNELKDISRKNKSKEFYILCNSIYQDENIWFAISCINAQKSNLPLSVETISGWSLEAIHLDLLNTKTLLARTGHDSNITEKNVCIVGAGSLGGYIANMLASAGLGKMTLVDDDIYKIENIHRHTLNATFLFNQKALSLKIALENKYPFINIKSINNRLLDVDKELWNQFDLIIVAIGSPNVERKFNEFIRKHGISSAVLYTWTEPFGVGGHAIASLPNHPGCLACCYIENESDQPSLYPNVNFIDKHQPVLSSVGGCGTDFLAFSNLDSIQTATITSKLAIKYLNKELLNSVIVSWKGELDHSRNNELKLTHRYYKFNKSMEEIPLKRMACTVCD